ncbi:MAG: transcriptional regulator [Streptococcus pyogenes]|nr:MAG: transcriptional regulator [Streptococcus pyogenes]
MRLSKKPRQDVIEELEPKSSSWYYETKKRALLEFAEFYRDGALKKSNQNDIIS